jgi:hypothetical protein
MISVLTVVFRKYLETPFEDFTSKLILAIGIFEVLDKFDPKDLEDLKRIEKNTTDELGISLYKLDRVVNPVKGEFKYTDNKFSFNSSIKHHSITLTENEIQVNLCQAIRRVNDIVFKNLKPYKIEQSFESMGIKETSDEWLN